VTQSWRDDVRAAVPGWLAGRVLVAVAWGAVLALIELRLDGVRPVTTAQGLFAWDGAYYRDIAAGGYDAVEPGAIRFHPLFPLVARSGLGLLVLANLGALAAGAVVHRLARVETGDGDLARRAATLVGVAAPAFCTVWAYAEGPFLALGAGQLLALRYRRWWWAGALGALATLTRPTGLLLAIPALVAGWQTWRTGRRDGQIAIAVLSPVVAMAGWLAWVGQRYGDPWAPLTIQSDLRGGVVLPPLRLLEGLGEMVADPLGDGLHIPFAFGTIALVWVCWRRLPGSWTALAAVGVALNLAADNLNSTERYAYGLAPLLVALASVTGGRWWRPTVAASSLLLVGMAALAWYGRYVP
jgi:hypothetical protein